MSVTMFRRPGFGDDPSTAADLIRELVAEGLGSHIGANTEADSVSWIDYRIGVLGYPGALAELRGQVQAQPINPNPPAWLTNYGLGNVATPDPSTQPILHPDPQITNPPVVVVQQPPAQQQLPVQQQLPPVAAGGFLQGIEDQFAGYFTGIANSTGLSVGTLEIIAVVGVVGLFWWMNQPKGRR